MADSEPVSISRSMDELERLTEAACEATREIDEKLFGGKSPLQPIPRHVDAEYTGPVALPSAKQRVDGANDRLTRLLDVLQRLARGL